MITRKPVLTFFMEEGSLDGFKVNGGLGGRRRRGVKLMTKWKRSPVRFAHVLRHPCSTIFTSAEKWQRLDASSPNFVSGKVARERSQNAEHRRQNTDREQRRFARR